MCKRCPGGPHICEHQRTHAGLSSTRQWPPTACTPSLAAALVGAPQQRLASAKSAASTKLWKRPGLPPGMRQHSPCDHPPTCRQQWSALTSPTAWHHDRWSRRLACGAAVAAACSRDSSMAHTRSGSHITGGPRSQVAATSPRAPTTKMRTRRPPGRRVRSRRTRAVQRQQPHHLLVVAAAAATASGALSSRKSDTRILDRWRRRRRRHQEAIGCKGRGGPPLHCDSVTVHKKAFINAAGRKLYKSSE